MAGEIFEKRKAAAIERERLGVNGEVAVLQFERDRLEQAHRPDLAARVRLVSEDESFDIQSVQPDGSELMIEVKTTTRLSESDYGFWLTQNELDLAQTVKGKWSLYRVRLGNSDSITPLGNIILQPGWDIEPSTYFVSRKPGLNHALAIRYR